MSLFRRTKNNDKPIIRQILELIPNYLLNQLRNIRATNTVTNTRSINSTFVRTAEQMHHFDRYFSGHRVFRNLH